MKPLDQCWTISQAVGLATVLEATAPKLGNVHPGASFNDMSYGHFLASATAVASVFGTVDSLTVGQLVLASVQATRARVHCNTNLGTILLLAPLAKAASKLVNENDGLKASPSRLLINGALTTGVPRHELRRSVDNVLLALTPEDSGLVYEAIRVAKPGGLGDQNQNDVKLSAPESLLEAMRQVADIDAVARQYTNGFADLFDRLLPWLDDGLCLKDCPLRTIVQLQLQTLAWQPDGLIYRKCGLDPAQKVQSKAQRVLQLVESKDPSAQQELDDFDTYLRADGNKLNPGTTADLIAATLFCRMVSHIP